ncbi:phage tail tape measure protein [Nocardioides sp. T2.26MG-1]|uniref:phage tail tape measure protein n=1 Tax=Nocardioides sp. T2.26MG-1 TaxID=3041166 RepID=UPI0024778484|nr:phage tail tape measure protein [Nocardioides sp. T2.26MG-1]CAI9417388.1 hypothetical protein HIDPHFAB_03007 [Nocardioides sp. T2.26MG-1]
MAVEARSVVVRLTAETAQYIAQMQAAGRISATAMKPAEAAVMRQSAAIDDLGGKAGKLGLAAAAGLAGMGKAAIDWESQWAGVAKTVDGTSGQLNALEDDLRGLAREMPATHQEIAATAEAAGQLGVATGDITDFTKVMVEMGETTNLTADAAATSIAQFMNVMQTAAGDVDEIGNTIVDLGNKGASTEAQITEMAQRVAGAGTTIGATEADVLGLSAAMANLGIQSELGGGAVQRVLLGINTQVASGGEKLQDYADVAGTSADEFARAWGSDPVRAFDMLVQGLGRIQDSGGDVASVLGDMGIKGTQNLQVMLRLAGSGDMLSRSLDQSNAAWEQNTALTDEYGKRAETTASQVQVAWNQIKDAAIEGGAAVLPVVADIATGIGTVADAYGSLPGPIQDITTGALALTAILGGGLWFGAKVVNGITSTRASLATLRPEISRVGTTLATRSGVRPFIADLGIMATTSRTAGATTTRELARVQAASQRVRSSLFSSGLKGAGLLAGIALASSDAADGLALTNTASYALMGLIAGPWGAAIGGGVGLIKDFRDTSKDAAGAIDGFNDSLDDTDVTRMLAGFEALQSKTTDLNADLEDTSFILSRGWKDGLSDTWSGIVDLFGTGADELNQASDKSVDKLTNLTGVLNGVALANNDFIASATDGLMNLPYGNLEDLARVGSKVQPVLDELGYSLQDLMSMKPGSDEAVAAVQAINDALAHADSNAGRVEAVDSALDGLGNQMETTADRADALSSALDDLLDPNISLSAATDEWTTALRHLNDDLDKNNRTLKGNSDAAIKNRAAIRDRVGQIKDLLVAEADAGASSGKLRKSLLSQRDALIDAGKAAGISREDMRAYLKVLGLTPKLIKTVIQADTGQAMSAMDKVARLLRSMDGDTATTYVRTVYQHIGKSTQGGGMDGDPSTPQAGGGFVPKTGLPYADRHPYLLADGEGVTTNRRGETDRFRDVISGINAGMTRAQVKGMLADGGFAGAGGARSLDERLEIAQLLQTIRGYRHDLAAGGKDHLSGIARRIAELQLEAAERDLRRAKHADEREAAQAAREKAQEQRQQRAELSAGLGGLFDSIFPPAEQTRLQQVTAAIADFQDQWLAAGGQWTQDLRDWAHQAEAAAAQYDANAAAIEAEQTKRDELAQTLDEQKSQLEQLTSTMESFGSSVAGNFTGNPFTRSSLDRPAPGQTVLEQQLAGAQAAGDAAAASRLMQQIALAQASGATGLEALRASVEGDIADAEAFTAALAELASKGLDTTGPLGVLYAQLAASGDVVTAEDLADLSAAQIDEYEKLFAAREDVAAVVAAQATQAMYGEQFAQMVAVVDQSTAAVRALDATITVLEATQAVLGEQVRAGAEAGAAQLHPDLRAIKGAVDELPRKLQQLMRTKG